MKPHALGGLSDQPRLFVMREGGHGKGFLARAAKGLPELSPAHADLIFGLFIERLQIVVADGPVGEGRILDLAVCGLQAKVLGHEAPGHRAIADGPAADAAGVVVVFPFAGKDNVR